MEYSINKLAQLAGISPRTLRYYDEIGLLKPRRISNGYRIYGQKEIDLLQQILLYRAMQIPLKDIASLLYSTDFDSRKALETHLSALLAKRKQIDRLIQNVRKTLEEKKGKYIMNDTEKFEGFKQEMIESNDVHYGQEIREKYGTDTIEASYQKIKNMTNAQHLELERLSQELAEALKTAVSDGNPSSDAARHVCHLHKEWLSFYWPTYTPEAHRNLAQMYVDDERFTQHYDKIVPGGAVFLRDALNIYCQS